MNWAQFKDLVSDMCLAGAVVASWSLTQDVAGSSPFVVMTNILSLNSVKTLKKNSSRVCTDRGSDLHSGEGARIVYIPIPPIPIPTLCEQTPTDA